MSIFAIFTAIIILGIVWGGLTFFLTRAMKYEKLKSDNGKKQS
ncbi:MAG TPA: MetS family NSS transporter small subunit [Ignavibacteriaceae bacterium]|nr:MetS family NSS transporter small subunit [Ignavibacteriaceae bacterium]